MRRPNEGTSDDPTRETIRDEYQDARTPIVSLFCDAFVGATKVTGWHGDAEA
jgi:hypothetical protein